MRYLLLFIFCFAHQFSVAADSWTREEFKKQYGKNKKFSSETELPALLALRFYPELEDVHIRFEHKPIYTTMSTRPRLSTCLFGKRKYVIYVNSNAQEQGSVCYDSLSIQQKLGIMAHELAHISDYEQQSTLQLLLTGLRYKTSKSFHRELERKTDEITIAHGLADPLYDFSYYVLYGSSASEKYKEFKKNTYLSPEEIRLYDAKIRKKRKSR